MMKMRRAQKPIKVAPGERFVKEKVLLRAAGLALVALGALLAGAATVARAQSQDAGFDTSAYARVLEKYVAPTGEVHYAELKRDPADLNAFVRELAAVSPENRPDLFPTPAARKAYWINAYNAFVLHGEIGRAHV